MDSAIHWFRRDLRCGDNLALSAAAQHSDGHVIPVFVLDNRLLRSERTGAARVSFMLDSLRALDAALHEHGSRLIMRHGNPADELLALAKESGATSVFWNRDYTPYAARRDDAVTKALQAAGIAVETRQDLVIFEPHELQTKAGTPYAMYAPYQRQWRARVETQRDDYLQRRAPPKLAAVPQTVTSQPIPDPKDLGFRLEQTLLPAGEAEGSKRLAAFARPSNKRGIGQYDTQRNDMANPATSQLSPYLHFGCVATSACLRTALHAADDAEPDDRNGIERWLNEIAWHDFYMQVLFHFPHVLRGAFKPAFDALPWDNNDEHFAAWCAGRTGYPAVDAAMRQLNREGWIHNRARLIVSSFLVKDLLIDWRWGERYFLQQLVDGDNAANNGGWQWIASTGADPQPFFRIFNPTAQAKKFDPNGDYVRRYVPELTNVAKRYIHEPWTMPAKEQARAGVTIGETYPGPIVDHTTQRDRALAMYRAIAKKKNSEATS